MSSIIWKQSNRETGVIHAWEMKSGQLSPLCKTDIQPSDAKLRLGNSTCRVCERKSQLRLL